VAGLDCYASGNASYDSTRYIHLEPSTSGRLYNKPVFPDIISSYIFLIYCAFSQ